MREGHDLRDATAPFPHVSRLSPLDWTQGREYVERRNVKRKIRIAGFPYERSTPYIFSSFSQLSLSRDSCA